MRRQVPGKPTILTIHWGYRGEIEGDAREKQIRNPDDVERDAEFAQTVQPAFDLLRPRTSAWNSDAD